MTGSLLIGERCPQLLVGDAHLLKLLQHNLKHDDRVDRCVHMVIVVGNHGEGIKVDTT